MNAFLAENVAAKYVIADFAELGYKQFLSKNNCDAINDLPTVQPKILFAFMREAQAKQD